MGSNLSLKQSRYLMEFDKKFAKGCWQIPLSIRTSDKKSTKLFSKKSISLKISKSTLGVIVNYGRKGFYRVKYDDGMLLDLKLLVDQKQVPAIDRWAIQNDLYSLCVSGNEKVRNYLDFSDAYFEEDSYLASINVAHNLSSLYFRCFGEKFSDEIKEYGINYLRKILSNFGMGTQKN